MTAHDRLTIGDSVYTEDRRLVGHVGSIDADGLHVVPGNPDVLSAIRPVARVQGYREAELVWRCGSCGAVGALTALPEGCPDCGAPREELYYWTED